MDEFLERAAVPSRSSRPTMSYGQILREVAALYRGNPKRRFDREGGNLFIMYFVRPVSVYLSPIFVMARMSANQATWTGFMLGLAGCILLGTGTPLLAKLGFWLFFACFMFDHIDGNLARYYGKTNHFGKFLDGSTGTIVESALYLGLGAGAYREIQTYPLIGQRSLELGAEYLLWLGGLAAAAILATAYLDVRYSNAVAEAGQLDGATARDHSSAVVAPRNLLLGIETRVYKQMIGAVKKVFDSAAIPALFVAVYTHAMTVWLLLFAFYRCAMFVVTYARIVYSARKTLNAFRSY